MHRPGPLLLLAASIAVSATAASVDPVIDFTAALGQQGQTLQGIATGAAGTSSLSERDPAV